ncbi:MAG: hypothetical protein E6J34_20850, partial [Chloroflexi bacterium]
MLVSRFPGKPSDPLFSRLARPFNHTWVIDRLHCLLRDAKFDPTNFSGHSFRRGAASTALEAGLSVHDIMQLGRWKSDSVQRYFSQSYHSLLNLSR